MNYRDIPRPGQSALKMCWNDPQLFHEIYVACTRPEPPPTEAQILGSNVERFLFYEGRQPDVEIIPESALNGGKRMDRKGEKNWTDFKKANAGKRLLKQSEYDEETAILQAIKANVDACPEVANLLYGGDRKQVILWNYLGAELKSELDILHPHVIVDLKAMNDVSPQAFSNAAARYGFNIQHAAYQIAAEQHTGKLLPFIFVAVQSAPSHRVEVYQLDEDFVQAGREQLQEMILFYQQRQETGDWHTETWGQLNIIKAPRWFEAQQRDWSLDHEQTGNQERAETAF